MPRREPYVPLHRAAPAPRSSARSARRGLRATLMLSGVAVAATGMAVSSGIVMRHGQPADSAAAAAGTVSPADQASASTALGVAADLGGRDRAVSRSEERTAVDPTKARVLSQASGGQVTKTENLTTGDPRDIARALLPQFGFGQDQFSCLDSIYSQESGWNVHADNPSSSAYGIPQALPGSKMSSAGSDWATDAATQIRWGLGYIAGRYGTPCSAWGFKQAHGWY